MRRNIEDIRKIGALVRAARKKKKWSQVQLAQKMGVHQTHISQWEKGERRMYGDDLLKIVEVLDIEDLLPFGFSDSKEGRDDILKMVRGRLHTLQKQLDARIKKVEREIVEDVVTMDNTQAMNENLQILVVEDNHVAAVTMQEAIYSMGIKMEVVLAHSGLGAYDILIKSKKQTSLIVLDLLLPGMNGIELLKKVKQNPKLETIPIILYSGADEKVIKEAFSWGVLGFIQKPFELNEFAAMVSKIDLFWPLKSPLMAKS